VANDSAINGYSSWISFQHPHAHGGIRLGRKSVAAQPTTTAVGTSILERLGIVGMESVEPVILAALIQQDPMLLIGPHGTGKSFLLNRLAAALRLEHRHYNASLLNFDDLVGYPLPNGSGGLDYIQTPASIWGAQSVFIDEVSRCRPEVQNKLFSIVHERCVQGLPLRNLTYRWSAMNPPSTDEGESAYAGSEPLNRALADRFCLRPRHP
jgi:MoxR-like ATPase